MYISMYDIFNADNDFVVILGIDYWMIYHRHDSN
jgi:hypothetical protein